MQKIIMVSNYSLHNKCVFDLTIKNHYDYCAKYGIDFMCTTGAYSPYNNTFEIKALLQMYDSVIIVGTDILFTDFSKDIRDFIEPEYSIIIQKERNNTGVNGDFIIFNNTSTIDDELDFLEQHKQDFWSTQAELDAYASDLNMLVLKPRTLQSINPTAYNGQEARWKQGDFSVHCHRPGKAPRIEDKVHDLTMFMKTHVDVYTIKEKEKE